MPAVFTDDQFLGAGQRPPISFEMTPPGMSDDDFLNAKPPEPKSWLQSGIDALGAIPQKAGSFATGANDTIATITGAPVDLMTAGLNLGSRAVNATGQSVGYDPQIAPIENPVGGSQSLRDLLAGTVGRTEPKSGADRLLYGAGAGAAGAAVGPLAGAGLAAAGRLPMLATALAGGAEAPATKAAMSAASGAGASGAEDLTGYATDSPTAKTLAGTIAGLGSGLAVGGALLAPRITQLSAEAIRPLSEVGQRQIAGRILNDAATFGAPATTEPPLGITPTLGDATNDPGLQALQRVVQQSQPSLQGDSEAMATANNQKIRGAMDSIGQPAGREPYQISAQTADQLDTIRQGQRAAERDAWQAVDPEGTAMVPIAPLRQNFQDYVGGLTAARRRFVPSDYEDVLNGFGDHEPMREVADLRSMLLNHERQARGAGDYNQANVLRGLDDALFERLPDGAGPVPASSDQAATLRYQNATDASRQYNQTYNSGPIRSVFRQDATGADVVPDSAVLERMLAPGQGQAERVGQYIRAAQGDADALQGGRDWFTAKMQQAANGPRQDANGDPFVLGNNLRKFVQANRPLIDSDLFSQEQRDAVDQIVDAANIVERTARAGSRGGSDTYRNLAGNNYISTLVGGWMKPVTEAAPQLAGGAAGFVYGGPAGATAGAYGAGKVMKPLIDRVYGNARDNVMNLIGDAVHDPDFARELMQNAPASRSQSVSPRLRNYLATLPITVETTGASPATTAQQPAR
jgi:hypothetical protein